MTDLPNEIDMSLKNETREKENLWSAILNDVQNHGNAKLPSRKQVLVLGNNEPGKTTIVAKLLGSKDQRRGWGLEYAYIDVRDDYRDDHTRLGVWVLDGDFGHTNLLKFSLNEETFPHTLVILTVSMTAPWGIMLQLRHWASVLADHLDKLNLEVNVREIQRQHMVKAWQEYFEEEEDAYARLKRTSINFGDDSNSALENSEPLPECTLTNNLGLDIVVVVTNSDYIQNLEKEHDYREEHLDFMQQHIRRFCLEYGAALLYTSAKENKNCDLLYKYITHRIYNFPLKTPALVVEKDAVFIPAGWDNMKKISILYENIHTCKPDDHYTDIIAEPITRKAVYRETEILPENEQTFLVRQQKIISSGIVQMDNTKVESSLVSDSALANFFNDLLHKKTATTDSPNTMSGKPKPGLNKTTIRSDAAAELDRLARGRKPDC